MNDINQKEFECTLMLLGFVKSDKKDGVWDRQPDLDIWANDAKGGYYIYNSPGSEDFNEAPKEFTSRKEVIKFVTNYIGKYNVKNTTNNSSSTSSRPSN